MEKETTQGKFYYRNVWRTFSYLISRFYNFSKDLMYQYRQHPGQIWQLWKSKLNKMETKTLSTDKIMCPIHFIITINHSKHLFPICIQGYTFFLFTCATKIFFFITLQWRKVIFLILLNSSYMQILRNVN